MARLWHHTLRTLAVRGRSWISITLLLPRAGKPLVILAILGNLVTGLLPLVFVIETSLMVSQLHVVGPAHRDGAAWAHALAALTIAGLALAVQSALVPMQAAVGEVVARRVDGYCAGRLIRVGVRAAPLAALDDEGVLNDLSDARAGLSEHLVTPGSAVSGLLMLISRYSQLTGAVAVVWAALGPAPGIIIAITACIARLGNRGSLARWAQTIGQLGGQRRRMRYVMGSGADISLGKEVRVLRILPWFTARARLESRAYYEPLWKARRLIYFGPFLGITFLVLLGAGTVLTRLGVNAARGGLSTLDISLAIQAILVPMRFGTFFPESDVQTQYGMSAYGTIDRLAHRFAEVKVGGRMAMAQPPHSTIRFENVTFTYPGGACPVLRGLNLELRVGQFTAIVGVNGSGKTTLVKLLAGMYEPDSGRITIDGTDLRALDVRTWQHHLHIVFQDYARYEFDVADNIGMGAPAHLSDTRSLREAAKSAGADTFIDRLPNGWETILSSNYSGGADLSGGQWQRIALARAMFALGHGKSVLVLDEPTAQLDARGEAAIAERLAEITRDATSVLISHRFSAVRNADHIAVLEGGRVAEQGDHAGLLRLGGRYATLFEIQASRFRAPGAS